MQTTEIQNPPPDMPVDWAVWIQTKLKQIYNDLHQLGIGIFVDINGNIGIGTTSPQQLLHLSADNTTMNEAIRLQNTGSSIGDEIGIYFRHYTDGRLQAFIKDELTSGWPTKLHFGTAAGVNNAATKMTIDGSGNVGIGTASPSQKLDIVAGGSGVLISDTGEGRGVAKSLFFGDGGGTWTPIIWGVGGATGDVKDAGLHLLAETEVADDSGTEPLIRLNARQRDSTPITTRPLLAIENDGSQLITVDKDGNVGIGTVETTYGKLRLTYPFAKTDTNIRVVLRLTSSELDASNPFDLKMSAIGAAAQADRTITFQVGEHDISNTGNLALQPYGGNVTIGTLSPTADAKLDVASTTGAFMPPRMTTVQRDALTASDGMMVFNTTTKRFEGRENGAWVDL